MNAQQLRDLAQKAYGKQKMASEKSAKTPAVLDFNTQSQGLALEGPNAKTMPSRHPGSGMHPRPTKNETPTLVPDLNRGTNAGMDRVDVNAHLDALGKDMGPVKAPRKSLGEIVEPAKLIWKLKRKNSWESNGNSKGRRQTHPGATSPRNRRKNSQRFQADRAQTEPTQEQETPPCFDSQELMKMMMKEFFQRKEEDRKWEKKEKPDSA